MKDLPKIRKVNKIEMRIIFNALSKICLGDGSILTESEYKLFVSFNNLNRKNKYPLIFLIQSTLIKVLNTISSIAEINSAGIFFGFIKKNYFYLSIEGAEFLYVSKAFPEKNKIIVTESGEKSILYGNNIRKDMLSKMPTVLKKNDFLLIFNQSSEIIAIGIAQVDYKTSQNLNSKDIIVLNLNDKGYYLRKKQQ